MEFSPGGDLRAMLENIGSMAEDHARFYVAEMCMAVTVLHQLGFIHRDLKPANFLVDATGHLKLTDFGLSKKAVAGFVLQGSCEVDPKDIAEGIEKPNSGMISLRALQEADQKDKLMSPTAAMVAKAYSCVGSPDYMAPEMLKGRGYDEGVDFWSLGCMAFELLIGCPPFNRTTREETFHAILNWEHYHPIADSSTMQPAAADFINRLVCGQQDRLGTVKLPVHMHPFLADACWNNLDQVESPFVPRLQGPHDTTYFQAQPVVSWEAELGRTASPKHTPRGATHFQSPPEQTAFAGYSFRKFPSNVGNSMQHIADEVQAHLKAKAAAEEAKLQQEQAQQQRLVVQGLSEKPQCTAVYNADGPTAVLVADAAEHVEAEPESLPTRPQCTPMHGTEERPGVFGAEDAAEEVEDDEEKVEDT